MSAGDRSLALAVAVFLFLFGIGVLVGYGQYSAAGGMLFAWGFGFFCGESNRRKTL